ncbi:THUMP domain-containing class I SAM-dependent RNA methyltransferase [Nitrospirillum amazonense]|uniref:THUMP domain-containing class I SAM-dependent RNA methyltransferase n=1 Tax=Nitrospirillum amazonense TaxID=28077 RepID=UPI00241224AC|nr:class I SAM-dependent RNA methyltransferase [Nitrospirillum amazonense]MDG3439545.1 class I SAM-dependent RNA methyltransferase [Nitrospirillum amazonense]
MDERDDFGIYVVTTPGLESALCAEMTAAGFTDPQPGKGGVSTRGGWAEVWRANLDLRGATRVLVRIGSFRALHLAQLDKRARRFPWAAFLRPDVPVKVEASCTKSRIYHAGAAAERITRALSEELGAPVADDAEIVIKARIDDDLCTFSIDTSGESLHKRGHKEAVNKAPMRETMAALFLRQCGYDGHEPVVDPMCGSGTFVIEAAEIAAGLKPGRSRSFAFERLAGFDAAAWDALKASATLTAPTMRFHGSDRDAGAVKMSQDNASRAGVADWTDFRRQAISDLTPPDGPAGLVIVNPPYGGRIGDTKQLYALYGSLGKVLRERFHGWRVGIITNEPALAKVTDLSFLPTGAPVLHGGIKVILYRTAPLA